jgi:predicted amidophosphoribosyltransferase
VGIFVITTFNFYVISVGAKKLSKGLCANCKNELDTTHLAYCKECRDKRERLRTKYKNGTKGRNNLT